VPEPRLRIIGLNKSFAAPVLRDVSLEIGGGEIRAVVGENGAGKSTLVNLLAGLITRDSGDIFLDGEAYEPAGPAQACAAGVSFAAQELSIVGSLSVAENILLRDLPSRARILAQREMRRRARELLNRVGAGHVSTDAKASALSLAERQLVELAKALATDCRLLILDEPTAALATPQARVLHDVVAELAATGVSVIYISHRLDDILQIADTVSVLRDGQIVVTDSTRSVDVHDLVRHMTGSALQYRAASPGRPGDSGPAIEVDRIRTKDLPFPVSFTAAAGEIIGLAGLAGSGRSELLQAVFGLVPLTAGHVVRFCDGERRVIGGARDASSCGMAFLGEDRQAQGLFAGHSILTNVMVPGTPGRDRPLARIERHKERAAARSLVRKLDIRCRDLEQDIGELSGGNQQKALIARWLHRGADVFLLDEPTRGVDIGTRNAIYGLLSELRAAGACILMASGEIDELMGVCDRILVLSGRKPVRMFARGAWSEGAILAAAFEAHAASLAEARHRAAGEP
jgi:ribose transport system ATP-binding protein